MSDAVNVKGLSDLAKLLEQVAPKIERNIMRGALRAGARVILPVAKGNVNSISGELAASLKAGSTARGGRVTGYVRTRHFRAKWVEFGTKPHRIKAKGFMADGRLWGGALALKIGGRLVRAVDHPGARPKPFLRPALDANAGAAVVAAGEYIKARLSTKHGLDTSEIIVEEEDAE